MSTNNPQISTHDDFESGASDLHITAFFNPFPQERQKALAKIRKQSGHSPETWEQLDLQAGVKSPSGEEEITADSPLPYQAEFDHSDNVLDEQIVSSTIVDTMLQAGFGVNSDLTTYAYTTQIKAGRMEADVDMNPRARSRQDRERNGLDGVPKPIVHVDYELDGRELEVARAHGDDPETRHARTAREAINRREAKLFWDGWGGEFNMEGLGAFTIGGLNQDNPDKIIQTTSTGAGWDDPEVLLDDINELHDQIEGQQDVEDTDDVPLVSEVGAYLMVPRQQWGNVMRQNYMPDTGATDEPVIDRINRKYPYINILPAPRLEGDTAIMLLNDPRYFQVVNAQGMTNTAWDLDGGYARRHKLISSRVPFVRIQPDHIRGIVRMTGV